MIGIDRNMLNYKENQKLVEILKEHLKEEILYPENFLKYPLKIQERLKRIYYHVILEYAVTSTDIEDLYHYSRYKIHSDFKKLVEDDICFYIQKERPKTIVICLKDSHKIQYRDTASESAMRLRIAFIEDLLEKNIQELQNLKRKLVKERYLEG